jgi:hypothetical protein
LKKFFFEIFNIPENNIISVKAAKVVRYCSLTIEKLAGYQQGPTGRKLFTTNLPGLKLFVYEDS